MPGDVYSNAFNFASYQDGQVDVRTGQFGAVISLATIRPQGATKASREIKLVFSMMKTDDDGYGIGWRLSNTEFDIERLVLSLASGEAYTATHLPSVDPPPAKGPLLSFEDLKLRNLVVARTDEETITVYYIDGTVETLRQMVAGDPYRTERVTFENGETFLYKYAISGVLTGIMNAVTGDTMLELEHADGELRRVRTRVQGGRIAEVAFRHLSNMTRVTVPYDPENRDGDPPEFVYTYTTAQGFHGIETIQNPMGGRDEIAYLRDGLQYSNQGFLPAVERWVHSPGAGQPDSVRLYEYSPGRNFTGYPLRGEFQSGSDNLYRVTGPYEYWSQQDTIDPDQPDVVLERVRTTFNKFHLTTQRDTQRQAARITEEFAYNETPAPFDEQPANLQMPRQTVIVFENRSTGAVRKTVDTVETDEYGNVRERTEASGIRYAYEYYDIAGEGDNCPAEPSGYFRKYSRLQTIIPAGGDGDVRATETTWRQLPTLEGGKSYFVLEKSRSESSGIYSTRNYVEDRSQPAIHGRLALSEIVIGGHRTTTRLSYRLVGTDLEERCVVEGFGAATSASRTLCTFTQLLLRVHKPGEPSMAFTYDILGRLLSETVAPDTSHMAATEYGYRFAAGPDSPARVEETETRGKRYVSRYDGLGRTVSVAEMLSGSEERRIKTFAYDRLGRMVAETVYDQLEGEELALTTRYEFNGWGEVARTMRPDGSIAFSDRDYAANIVTTGVLGRHTTDIRDVSTTVNRYNDFNKIAEVIQIAAGGGQLTTLQRQYDGFGRCISLTNVDGHRFSYRYDAFDRISSVEMQPVDGTQARTVTTEYVSHSSADLPTQVAINGIVLGRRDYDGIGRLIWSANGDAAPTRYYYEGEAMRPRASISPRDVRLEFRYNEHLGTLDEVASSSGDVCRFAHDPLTGKLTGSQSFGAERHIEYDDYQNLRTEYASTDGDSWKTAYEFSPAGRPLRAALPDGDSVRHEYDAAGRLHRTVTENYSRDIAYDEFGRMQAIRFSKAGIEMETAVAFDEFGREATRTVRAQGNDIRSVHSRYSDRGQLIERHTTDARGSVSRERFGYDAYSRLIGYGCDGERYPTDSANRRVQMQEFAYDALDNITRVETRYADGTLNVSSRRYSRTIPTQLVAIRETNPAAEYSLEYDASGNLVTDHRGRKFSYDGFDRLSESSLGGAYGYDADGRLVMQRPPDGQVLRFLYAQDQLVGQRQGETSATFHRDGSAVRAHTVTTGSTTESELYGLDASDSVVSRTGPDGETAEVMYTPYGDSALARGARPDQLAARPRTGFNGQQLDALANLYHLGNGRRTYSPELMIFLSPDPLAPFDQGGFNAYGYCNGDPINRIDPTGLMSNELSFGLAWIGWMLAWGVLFVAATALTGGGALAVVGVIGAAIGVVSAGTGLASSMITITDKEQKHTDAANTLSTISLVTGIISIVFGAVSAVGAGIKATKAAWTAKAALAARGEVEMVAMTSSGAELFASQLTPELSSSIASRTLGGKTFRAAMEGLLGNIEGASTNVNRLALGVGALNLGVGAFSVTYESVKRLTAPVANQSGNNGANGNGRGEQPLIEDGPRGQVPSDAHKPVLPEVTDPVASQRDLVQRFNRMAAHIRGPINAARYRG